ncbi:NifU family protein [Haloactinomyces albus]|uniref:Fe-S cluster biogenesis protein NfuA/nitrite reductase/ring-hydroxylating ferredoxin subunit n=1 Tax=Haloactinomyces albus TaxID=1352928 RepID=A0AAE3ZEC8_9ACTN|nr:NifU family protein [Haloactinomyces albus]MDR7303362.1 Fe-S cluster biogenesis protein NfuA/nitrite reductase/ring-hydroxylating ferredoxin subunit [Haloactinomyces albus]
MAGGMRAGEAMMAEANNASVRTTCLEERIAGALDSVRPYLRSHSGDVGLLGLDETAVRLRLLGNCRGCPSSAVTVTLAIEDTIRQVAPEITDIAVEGLVAPWPSAETGPGGRPLLPVVSAGSEPADTSDPAASPWQAVEEVAGLASGELTSVVVGDNPVLVCNVDGVLYAYRDRCPSCTAGLSPGKLDGGVLGCPACPERYEVLLAGRGERRPTLHLAPLPLLSDNGSVRIAVPAKGASKQRPAEQAGA